MEIILNNGDPMYFIGELEISEPQILNHSVFLKSGREIIGIAERGLKKFMLTSGDLKNIKITKVVDVPNWLLQLSLNAT